MTDELNQKPRNKPGPKPKNQVERGRTGADMPPAMQASTQGLVHGSREEAAHSAGRPTRVPMGNAKKLEVPTSLMEKGYYYRFFLAREGRIEQAKAAMYEMVVDEQGNNYSRQSGPYKLYLMRLPQKYRDEDNALKRERSLATLEQEAGIGANEYAPNGGDSAIRHSISDSHQA